MTVVLSRSVRERVRDDLAHVGRQVGLRGDARDRLARRAAVRLGELAPAAEPRRGARPALWGDGRGPHAVLGQTVSPLPVESRHSIARARFASARLPADSASGAYGPGTWCAPKAHSQSVRSAAATSFITLMRAAWMRGGSTGLSCSAR